MKIYIQWATSVVNDWEPHDIRATRHVRDLPNKPVPTSPTQPVDPLPGWVNAINCQGITFDAFDHYAVEPVVVSGERGLRITGWQDSADFPPGTRYAVEWTLLDPAPDPNLGGQPNTRQTRRIFDESGDFVGRPNVFPWSEFTPPPSNMTRHGKWLPNESFRAHAAARSHHGWREWVTT